MSVSTDEGAGYTGTEIASVVAARVQDSDVFESVNMEVREGARAVCCEARESPSPIWYRALFGTDGTIIEFATEDRWLSQSIEADLVNTGDALEDLLEEELIDHDCEVRSPRFEHFRSDDMEYVFRVKLENASAQTVAAFLLSFEACFGELGDVRESDDE
ncbi:MAG: hypothetical protein H6815_07790 [Phycisphaeraceae bacterium]|nr:hypothetical protein [Phycisphaerales bacterium]MCB9860342.1 hypothetical protein [Phycisphaeraceae bacterium]